MKKILISGFDPFGLKDIAHSNPSGATALALDGVIVRHPSGVSGQIQSVIVPVTYSYFDTGRIESFFRPYISGSSPIDMVMTISQGGDEFELEEFNARYRNPRHPDNESELGGRATLPLGGTFTRTTLPTKRMRWHALSRPAALSAEREFQGLDAAGRRISGPTTDHPDPSELVSSLAGSGGDYLSNEIAYRTTLLRDSSSDARRRLVPVGHLHVPIIHQYAAKRRISFVAARDQIIAVVRKLIIEALPTLSQ